jgi:hypothetical protein
VVVTGTTLDEFFDSRGWPPIDIIKMDIEGAEKFALLGMKELVRRNPRLKLIMEFELRSISAAGETPLSLVETLLELGFGKFSMLDGSKASSLNLPRDLGRLIRNARRHLYVNLLCET